MKLILAIINKEDSTFVSQELTKAGYSVTKLATTGGFLMSGNITLIIGTEDDKVDDVLGMSGYHICAYGSNCGGRHSVCTAGGKV